METFLFTQLWLPKSLTSNADIINTRSLLAYLSYILLPSYEHKPWKKWNVHLGTQKWRADKCKQERAYQKVQNITCFILSCVENDKLYILMVLSSLHHIVTMLLLWIPPPTLCSSTQNFRLQVSCEHSWGHSDPKTKPSRLVTASLVWTFKSTFCPREYSFWGFGAYYRVCHFIPTDLYSMHLEGPQGTRWFHINDVMLFIFI